jgi:hypothetical protein
MKVPAKDRVKAGAVYSKYKDPFLATIPGAESKKNIMRIYARLYQTISSSRDGDGIGSHDAGAKAEHLINR